jgi:hypothetical protein
MHAAFVDFIAKEAKAAATGETYSTKRLRPGDTLRMQLRPQESRPLSG